MLNLSSGAWGRRGGGGVVREWLILSGINSQGGRRKGSSYKGTMVIKVHCLCALINSPYRTLAPFTPDPVPSAASVPPSPDPVPRVPSEPPALSRLSVTGECKMSLLRRSMSSETVALMSMHWQERGTWEGRGTHEH